ncbi:MAG: large conductance mechanosensitive channel protein MscL [Methylophaga sp.]|nr:MAG: large conductance mechanosensitive channel protein MscL [Methylophaga sp.]
MSFLSEFKDFAVKGNVVDMAVGIIIGAAFGKIVASLVADVIMPPIGVAMGGVDFSNLAYVIQAAAGDVEAVTINWGKFVMTILDFIIVALAIFVGIKAMNSMKKKEEEAPKEDPKPSNEEVLLSEIRDLLKK